MSLERGGLDNSEPEPETLGEMPGECLRGTYELELICTGGLV